MKRTDIRYNLKGLEDFRRQLGNTYIARVGILAGHTERKAKDPLSNVEIGLIQLFGSITNNIPPRDFLIMPLDKKQRELIAAMRSPAVKAAMDQQDYKKVFQILGEEGEKIVHEAFKTSGFGMWPPNKPATIKAKGSSMPLIDTRQLDRAVTSDVVKKGSSQHHGAAAVTAP